MGSEASGEQGSACWAQWLLLALLSDTSNSGQPFKLRAGVSRVPVVGSSSNLLWDSLKSLVFLFLLFGHCSFWLHVAKFSG